jgi:putative flippase GtrA
VGDIAANAVGYAAGLCASFVLNKAWTFRYSGPVLAALTKFVVAFGFAY